MISQPDRQALLALFDKFINSGKDVTFRLTHLLDLVNSIILDHQSEDFKDWSATETASVKATPIGKPGEWSVTLSRGCIG